MKLSSNASRRQIGSMKSSPDSSEDGIIAVAKIDDAIQSLKKAKRRTGLRYVIVNNSGDQLTLRMADGAEVLAMTDPTPKQLKVLNLKSRKERRLSVFGYRAEEGGELIAAIKENLKKDHENNKDFFANLDANLLKR